MKLALCCLVLASSARADTISLDPVSGAIGFTGKSLGDWSVSYERHATARRDSELTRTSRQVTASRRRGTRLDRYRRVGTSRVM
jgi:hypothetical protein